MVFYPDYAIAGSSPHSRESDSYLETRASDQNGGSRRSPCHYCEQGLYPQIVTPCPACTPSRNGVDIFGEHLPDTDSGLRAKLLTALRDAFDHSGNPVQMRAIPGTREVVPIEHSPHRGAILGIR